MSRARGPASGRHCQSSGQSSTVAPGQYELNLMELYDRQEYIIALQEDGKYTVQVPDRWE